MKILDVKICRRRLGHVNKCVGNVGAFCHVWGLRRDKFIITVEVDTI